jgi:hypothetical protein
MREEFMMVTQKSPGGSLFPYYYKGGELFGLHYGSFFTDERALLARMHAEEEFIKKENHPLPLWIDFYETKLTDTVLIEFSKSVFRLQGQITKLAIVGCSFKDKRRLHKLGKKSGFEFPMPVRFFSDPEEAKTWLVSESVER